ncbi:FAD-dependent oxidoreductase [Leuconostoc litchii]|uniref:FAD-dependent oxidoreductase n=1 Tax=Leuconostoc litchii TaxID=1981069 RepID=A0A652NDY7_9LACO|nr:FAD/NAD(P)-binding domain-containing protein [Leuconostoc litchii]TYC46142.1 FAD-dependent oxidoreductase [Leuconostoc litchii]GMA69897.1 FAD-dependent oxidoreductase [Leuconostoc litchii]
MQVAIIGAGPRGLAVAERLINLADDSIQLDVQIFDPYVIGGRVWDPFIPQNKLFLMNTFIDQVTLFTDDTIEHVGKPLHGPTLFQWLQSDAADFLAKHKEFDDAYLAEISHLTAPSDFATRGMMGIYAAWYFEWLQKRLRSNQTLNFTKQNVNNINSIGTKYQVILSDGTQILANQVVLALGHVSNELTEEEAGFKLFASENNLKYLPPMHPAEANLAQLTNNDTVIIRGLGLSFYDYMAGLSIGKGGYFSREVDGELIYHPSGKEPHIIAGSRSGVPLHARGRNEKDTSEVYEPTFFTLPALEALRAAGHGQIKYSDFEKLLVKELTYKHLLNRIDSPAVNLTYDQAQALKQALLSSGDLNATAADFGLIDEPAFDINEIRQPAKNLPININYQDWMMQYLAFDIQDARLGNKQAPFAGAFDILRDLRDRIRFVVEHEYFSADEYELFLRYFKPLDVMLSVGPPLQRVEQLRALMKAGIAEIMGANLQVITDDKKFVARDSRGNKVYGNALVDARVGATNIDLSVNSLIINLRNQGILSAAVWTRTDGSTYRLGAANADVRTLEVITKTGERMQNLYIYGIPLEGKKWFGTVIPRPGVNTVILREAAWIAQQILA